MNHGTINSKSIKKLTFYQFEKAEKGTNKDEKSVMILLQ